MMLLLLSMLLLILTTMIPKMMPTLLLPSANAFTPDMSIARVAHKHGFLLDAGFGLSCQ